MIIIPPALEAHYQLGTTTVAHLLRIERADGQIYAYTSFDQSLTVDGTLYDSSVGLDVSSLVKTAGLTVDNLEMTVLQDDSVITLADVLTGVWRNAAFAISKCNWASPSDGPEPVMSGTFGEISPRRNTVVVELRDIKQYAQQPVGIVTSPTCRARFGDGQCKKPLGPLTFAAAITTAGQQVFAASALTQAADYFSEGIMTFTSGACAGLAQKVKAHTAGGVLTLSLPMLLPVQLGDGISVVAGCMKRWDADCRDKHNNILNFFGEERMPLVDALSKP